MFLVQYKKNNEAGNSLNDVEREPVPTRVLNPTASEASYKPEQHSKVPRLHIVCILHTKSVNKTGWRSPTLYIKHFNSLENRKGLNKF